MLNFFLLWCQANFLFPLDLLRSIGAEGWRHAWKRLLLFLPLIPAYWLLNLLHLAGFLLDEILFPEYRHIAVEKPLFILGIPRSGTTHLQRVLAKDPQFTCIRTWEVLLAPSVTERYLYRFLGRLLSPLKRFTAGIRRRLFGAMDDVHYLGLLEAEEDFFLLAWINQCFLTALLCPDVERYWHLARFSSDISPARQRRILRYYRFCLQKHLLFHGVDKRYLCKNPSFTSLLPALLDAFPNGRFIACIRPPEQVVASQLSSLRPAMTLLGSGKPAADTQNRLLEMLKHYYALLGRHQSNPRLSLLPMATLQSNVVDAVQQLYHAHTLKMDASFVETLQETREADRRYKTKHHYALTDFSLSDATIHAFYQEVWPLGTAHNVDETA